MRKAFKVATIFTGTAACAAAFAPAAGAATTARTQLMEPATTHKNCVVGPRTTSMVFWWPASAHHGPTCVGDGADHGIPTKLGDTYFSSLCTGNNSGYITSTFGSKSPFTRSVARTYIGNIFPAGVRSVSIKHFGGGFTCST